MLFDSCGYNNMEDKELTSMFNKKQLSKRSLRKRTYEDSSSEDESKILKINTKPNISLQNYINKKNNNVVSVTYKSSGVQDLVGRSDQGATACLETETESNKDARAIFERSLRLKDELRGKSDDRVYRGISSYENKTASIRPFYKGPTRAPTNIRTTCQWDYQPDICKDFKETGYCGFGDSCKFLHDRTDYKYGWEIERTHSKGEEKVEKYEINSSDEDKQDLPFKCYICRKSFFKPVITKCLHYFCEKCALDYFKKNSRCFICKKQTSGIFKPADKLIAKLKCDN